MIYFFFKKKLYVFFKIICADFFSNIELVENLALLFKKNIVNCYNVFLYDCFSFFLWIFPKMVLFKFFFSYWASWGFSFVVFFYKKNIVDCYSISPTWFLFCYNISPNVFVSKFSLLNFFFNIELVDNLALAFPTCFFLYFFCFCFLFFFPKIVFFFMFFSELFLSILFF